MKRFITIIIIVLFLILFVNSCKLFCDEELVEKSDEPLDKNCDGEVLPRIAFLKEHNLWIMDRNGCNQTQLTDGIWINSFCFSPDGDKICFTDESPDKWDIYVINSDGENKINLTSTDDNSYSDIKFTPDGKSIVFNGVEPNIDFTRHYEDIFIMSLEGGNPINLTNTNNISEFIGDISPDGSKIIYRFIRRDDSFIGGINSINPDGTGLDTIIFDLITTDSTVQYFNPIFTPNGKIITTSWLTTENIIYDGMFTMELDGNNFETIIPFDSQQSIIEDIKVSPDGLYIIFNMGIPVSDYSDTYIIKMYLDSKNQIYLTEANQGRAPNISYDSKYICYESLIQEIFIMNQDGTNKTQLAIGHSPKFQPLP